MSRSLLLTGMRLKEGREEVEDDLKSGRPSTSETAENVERVRQKVKEDRRIAMKMITEEAEMKKNTV